MNVVQKITAPGCGCDAPEHMKSLITIDEALSRIADNAAPIQATEQVAPGDAHGRILAGPVRSRAMTPPFDNAAMDGYAVDTTALSGAGPWTLSVSARVPAGQFPNLPVTGLSAAWIFTGAPVPAGADAVMMQEEVQRTGATIRIDRRPSPGQNIRRAGSDMAAGEIVLDAGQRLGPREIAACAAAGAAAIDVVRPLRVGLLVTGNEVRQSGSDHDRAQIWDVNTPMLSAALAGPCVDVVSVELGADNRNNLRRQLAKMSERTDIVITTGGVSVGEEDHVKPALGELGAETFFSGVAIKPGKPVSFGRLGSAFWLGLPGNPLAAFVTWQLFGTALVRALTGQPIGKHARRHVITAHTIRRKPGRCELRPATIAGFDDLGREVATFEPATHSGRVGRLPQADGLLFLPADIDELPEDALVEFLPFCDL